jgi:hypothetical protein
MTDKRLTLATRNMKHFNDANIDIVNPRQL